MKKTLSALLAMFLSLNLFVSAVPVLETHVEAASKQTEYAEEATLAEDGIPICGILKTRPRRFGNATIKAIP